MTDTLLGGGSKSLNECLKPTEKTYIVDGVEYIGSTDFIKNRLSIKCRDKTILNEKTLEAPTYFTDGDKLIIGRNLLVLNYN